MNQHFKQIIVFGNLFSSVKNSKMLIFEASSVQKLVIKKIVRTELDTRNRMCQKF